jgi:uncharacterized repeat protein (TIGR03803 family)
MSHKRLFVTMTLVASAIAMTLLMSASALAQTETVLHSFTGTDGTGPVLGLIFDHAGNLYGVTTEGGSSNNGAVFELSPGSRGTWSLTTLHSFYGGKGGSTPLGGLVMDSLGSLYGTTKLGGGAGVGVVFRLSKSSSGWTQTVLHTFGGGGDGRYPSGSLAFDAAGNLYGTTQGGGAYSDGTNYSGGTVYQVSPTSGGGWTEKVVHSFGNGTDGLSPRANVIVDKAGNLYGTTIYGGANSLGTVFEVSPGSGGSWNETVLYSFNPINGSDGWYPVGGVVFDTAGNLFGTTTIGSTGGGGIIFELSPQTSGTWSETVLYGFYGPFRSEQFPYSNLTFDTAGNLYGTTLKWNGTVFKLTPIGGGVWNETTVYHFDNTHGGMPAIGSLVMDSSGNLYGATQNGGANQDGIVFKITP